MPKPTYDDLVFLIVFIYQYLDRDGLDVLEALRKKNGFKTLVGWDDRWKKYVDEKEFKRANKIIFSLKDTIKKHSIWWGD